MKGWIIFRRICFLIVVSCFGFLITNVSLLYADSGQEKPAQNERRDKRSALYQRWITDGIAHSRNGHVVLVVNKQAHEMAVYLDGEEVKRIPVEIGMESQKDGGWRPTPIGVFDLSYKSYTKYYKALLFKMPGYYEIHGMGTGQGKNGQDWTWGCIALSNEDMDLLFEAIGLEREGKLIGRKERFRLLKQARLIVIPGR